MTAVADIISEIFREPNLVAAGIEVTDVLQAEALAKLNRAVRDILGKEVGELLIDWPVPPPQRSAPVAAQYPYAPCSNDLPSSVWPYPPSNVRLMNSIATVTTLFLQNAPNDGARVAVVNVGAAAILTLNGNGRLIDDGSTSATTKTFATSDTQREWFYRADLGTWLELLTLEDGDDMPYPLECDNYFIARVAIEMAPRFGKQPQPATIEMRDSAKKYMQARYRQPTRTLGNASDAPNSLQTYNTGWGWMQ